jgi:hypothetical protein
MANSGTFRKGHKRPNQGKHGPPKATLAAREAISHFLNGNVHRLQQWLDEIEATDGPRAAFTVFAALLEYHVPKLSRAELTGVDDGPQEIVVRWLDSTDPLQEG